MNKYLGQLNRFAKYGLLASAAVVSAHAADYTEVANVTTGITGGVTSATTVFWALVTLSTAGAIVGLLFKFLAKGKR